MSSSCSRQNKAVGLRRMRRVGSSGWVVVAALLLTGCIQHYWTRSQGTLQQFAADHRECLEKNSQPVVDRPGFGVPNEQDYRRCLISRGWVRRELPADYVPAGHYRGFEERELGPVRLGDLPEQPASATVDTTDPRYFVGPNSNLPPNR